MLPVLTPLTSAGPQDQHLVDEDTLEEDGSQDAELLGLTEDAVYTTMRFSRPFRSCDPHDLDITVLSGGEESSGSRTAFPPGGAGVSLHIPLHLPGSAPAVPVSKPTRSRQGDVPLTWRPPRPPQSSPLEDSRSVLLNFRVSFARRGHGQREGTWGGRDLL